MRKFIAILSDLVEDPEDVYVNAIKVVVHYLQQSYRLEVVLSQG
jgi:hypothetical protein